MWRQSDVLSGGPIHPRVLALGQSRLLTAMCWVCVRVAGGQPWLSWRAGSASIAGIGTGLGDTLYCRPKSQDPRNSKLFFTELNEEQVNAVVSQFGSKPRFQIQPVEWYRGANLTNMSAVYEVWIKKTHKETWSPMLYASVLAMFWTIPGVLQAQSPVKIHVLGPSKLPLGLTETGHSLLKTRYCELVAAIGAVFKDPKTRQFLDRDIISKPTVPSTWKKELVGTMYILDVAPWWYLSDLT